MPSPSGSPTQPAADGAYRLACVGLSGFENDTLDAYFRLSSREGAAPSPGSAVRMVGSMEQAQLLLAEAGTPATVRLVVAAGRLGDTLFIGGSAPPPGALAWLPRPVDALQVHRALGELIHRRQRRSLQSLLGAGRRGSQPSGRARQQALDHTTVQDFQLSTGYSNSVLADGDARLEGVLVVSSSPAERRMLRDALRSLGYRVSAAADGSTAQTAAQRRAWRFIFLGTVQAGSDPFQLCRQLKHADLRGQPIFVMVGTRGGPTDQIRATFAGCDDWLPQPFDEADLLQLLRRHDAMLERVFEPTAPLAL